MAVQFVVEDGTGLSTSTSYVELAEFRQYWENKGVDYSVVGGTTDAQVQVWLNEATAYTDLTYCWPGALVDEDQALAVPRTGWVDVYGRDLDDSVPTYLKNGVCELAGTRQGTDPEAVSEVGVSSQSYGPVSVSYSGGRNGQTITYPTASKWFGKMQQCGGLRAWPA
jgi:hypothetical protein